MPATTNWPSVRAATAPNPRRIAACLLLAGLGILAMAPACATSEAEALHVLNRLSFGPAPGDLARVTQMGVDAYIAEQLHPERISQPVALQRRLATLPLANASPAEVLARFRAAKQDNKGDNGKGDSEGQQRFHRQLIGEFSEARLLPALYSPRQLEAVMVDFWFNHFNVFIGKGLDHALVASYEREAIRPHALGRFRDLLSATAHHPAMLFYLDNWLSAAPGFQPAGGNKAQARVNGLNENYARELMELHTLGVDGGYTQQDVTELARMLTGWTFDPRGRLGNARFIFDPRRHDPGVKNWLGRHIAPSGRNEGEQALDILAAHPATARHIAFKLAQAFVADTPPPALVDRLANRFRTTDGDIRAVLDTLFHSPEFRAPEHRGTKFKTPYRYVLSSIRAANPPLDDLRPLLGALKQQGMPLYGCQTPDGYKNTEAAWLNPDALTRRASFATALASGRLLGDDGKLPTLSAATLQASLRGTFSPKTLAAANDSAPALRPALLLGSPDFMFY